MRIYLLDEHTHDELGTPSLFYEVEERDLPKIDEYSKITAKIS